MTGTRGVRRRRCPPSCADRSRRPRGAGARLRPPRHSSSTSRLKDLGEHRLKDLSAPERVYQLGDGSFPALKSLYRTDLPVPATPFLGRERSSPRSSSVLLGGRCSSAHPHRAWWDEGRPGSHCRQPPSPLTPIPTASGGSRCAASRPGAGARDRPRRRSSVIEQPDRPLEDVLAEMLTGKRMLLLFDNAEHLLPDAAAAIAALRDLDGPKAHGHEP